MLASEVKEIQAKCHQEEKIKQVKNVLHILY